MNVENKTDENVMEINNPLRITTKYNHNTDYNRLCV